MCSEKLKGLVIKKISVFLVSALAYFVGAWLFAAIFIFQRYEDRDQRFFVIFLLMPIMYVCFTILLLLFNKHIIGIQSARALQLSAGAFIGLSAFLFSLDGVGSFKDKNSVLVTTSNGEQKVVEGEFIIINTGSKEAYAPFEITNSNVFSSKTLLDLKTMPKHILS